jgi:hypothetical protein
MLSNIVSGIQSLIRNTLSAGKQQVEVLKLANERARLEQIRARALADLGHLAWAQQAQHPAYAPSFARLVELKDRQRATQDELETQQADAQQDEALKQQLEAGFAARRDALRQRQQSAAALLTHAVGAQEPTDAKASIQSEIASYDQALAAINVEQEQALGPILARLMLAQRRSRDLAAQLRQTESQQEPVLAVLGGEVLAVKPDAPALANALRAISEIDSRLGVLLVQIDALKRSRG